MAKIKPESLLAKRIANYMKVNYPKIPYRFDTGADVFVSMGTAKKMHELHGKFSKGYPDVFIAHCKRNKKGRIKYGGLYIELKATSTVPNTEHTRRQAMFHAILRGYGYKVDFACGYDAAIALIDSYLK